MVHFILHFNLSGFCKASGFFEQFFLEKWLELLAFAQTNVVFFEEMDIFSFPGVQNSLNMKDLQAFSLSGHRISVNLFGLLSFFAFRI